VIIPISASGWFTCTTVLDLVRNSDDVEVLDVLRSCSMRLIGTPDNGVSGIKGCRMIVGSDGTGFSPIGATQR